MTAAPGGIPSSPVQRHYAGTLRPARRWTADGLARLARSRWALSPMHRLTHGLGRLVWLRLLLVSAALLYAVPAWAQQVQVYFVAPNGSNSNPGTLQQPWKTIGFALRHARQPGDTVYLRQGVYALSETLRFLYDGAVVGGPITLATYPIDPERAVLDGGSLPSSARAMLDLSGRRFINITGLELRNMRKSTGPHAMVLIGDEADNLRLTANVFHGLEPFQGYQGSGRALACLAGPSRTISQIDIIDNEFFSCLTGKAPVIEFAGQVQNSTFIQNIVRDNDTQTAVLLRQPQKLQPFSGLLLGTGLPEGIQIANNTIQRNANTLLGGKGIWVSAGAGVRIERNRLTDNFVGIELGANASDAQVLDVRIESNFIERSLYQGVVLGGAPGQSPSQVRRVQMLNNTLYANGREPLSGSDPGSCVLGQVSEIRLIGNLIVAASVGSIENIAITRIAGSNSVGIQLFTNLYWGENGQAAWFEPLEGLWLPSLLLWQSVTGMDVGSLEVNPQLSLPSTGNLTLTSASPARDAALTLSGTFALTDFYSQPRPVGAFADIGGHEY
jgi:Right handed beta helix region